MHGATIKAVIITTCTVQQKGSNYNTMHGATIKNIYTNKIALNYLHYEVREKTSEEFSDITEKYRNQFRKIHTMIYRTIS